MRVSNTTNPSWNAKTAVSAVIVRNRTQCFAQVESGFEVALCSTQPRLRRHECVVQETEITEKLFL